MSSTVTTAATTNTTPTTAATTMTNTTTTTPMTATAAAPVSLTFGPPREDEFETIGNIILDSFAESSRTFFGDPKSPDVLAFRVSMIRQRDSLRRLYEEGKIKTIHQTLVARDSKTDKVIGIAIWLMEDDWTESGIKQREDEIKLASPSAPFPKSTNEDLINQFVKTSSEIKAKYTTGRPTCYLKYLCVDANVQRSGAGTALLKIIRKQAGNRPIFLEAADTKPAVKFYTKLKFDDKGVFGVGEAIFNAMILEPTTRSLLDDE